MSDDAYATLVEAQHRARAIQANIERGRAALKLAPEEHPHRRTVEEAIAAWEDEWHAVWRTVLRLQEQTV